MSKIEWTDKTWNVITGCTQISPACDNCYAKAMTKRLQGMARKEVANKIHCSKCERGSLNDDSRGEIEYFCECDSIMKSFQTPKYYLGWDKVIFHKEALNDILDKKKYPSGSKVFVNSMSDTFHKDISDEDIIELFDYMSQRQDLIFQILTKRAENMLDYFNGYVFDGYLKEHSRLENYFRSEMYKHIWFGVTAENQECADKRIPKLLKLKDVVNEDIKCFVSIEPMIRAVNLESYLDRLDWVIVGGEKIPNNPKRARLMKLEWVESLYKQCKNKDVPFFFKQWGNYPTKSCHTRAESCMEFPR